MCCCREGYHPKQKPKPAKEAKKQRTIEAADAQLLDITETQRYQTLNSLPPAPVAEVIDLEPDAKEAEVFEDDVETPDELYDFSSAALCHEQQDAMEVRQDLLDVELHYDIEAALWDGEYVKASPFEEVSAFGDATDSQDMDLDAALNSVFG